MKESRLTDCLRILTGFGRGSWIFYGFFSGFLRGEGEQAYGLLTDSYRIWKRKFTDFLRIFEQC